MELFVLEGSLAEISAFVGKVRATKDTLTVDYSVLPIDEFGQFTGGSGWSTTWSVVCVSDPAGSQRGAYRYSAMWFIHSLSERRRWRV